MTSVRHEPDARRFTADVGAAEPAVLTYEPAADGTLDLQHTIVPPEARGRGVADALVRAAVAHAQEAGVRLLPTCPYVAAWATRHREAAAVFTDGSAAPGALGDTAGGAG